MVLLRDELSPRTPASSTHDLAASYTPSGRAQADPIPQFTSQWLTRLPTSVETIELPTTTFDTDLITLLTADIPGP